MHIAEVVTIAKSLPLLRLNTYKSLILSYSADYRRIFQKKNPLTESLIRDWLHVFYDHLHLADNTPSASPNLPGFVENRYDQSIFSILCKLRGITTLDGSETYAENWEQLSLFPFQDRRDMGIPRAGKKGWLEKCRQLLLSSKRNGLGIR